MVGLATFMIVSKEDVPQYECDFGRSGAQAAGGAPGGKKEDAAHLHQFVMHAALDFVDERQWETNAMNLKLVDRFNDMLVYAFVTAGGSRFLFLHDRRNEEKVREFFHEVHELYLRIQLNPFHSPRAPIVDESERPQRPALKRTRAVEGDGDATLGVLQLEPVVAEDLLRHLHAQATEDNRGAAARAALVVERHLCAREREQGSRCAECSFKA